VLPIFLTFFSRLLRVRAYGEILSFFSLLSLRIVVSSRRKFRVGPQNLRENSVRTLFKKWPDFLRPRLASAPRPAAPRKDPSNPSNPSRDAAQSPRRDHLQHVEQIPRPEGTPKRGPPTEHADTARSDPNTTRAEKLTPSAGEEQQQTPSKRDAAKQTPRTEAAAPEEAPPLEELQQDPQQQTPQQIPRKPRTAAKQQSSKRRAEHRHNAQKQRNTAQKVHKAIFNACMYKYTANS
jgi:hypothetical protein